MNTHRTFHVCIIAHNSWGALSGGERGHIGGAERQTTLLARWLAARGHTVTLLTWDEGQADGCVIDGVRVLKICRRDRGLPGIRFFHPRLTGFLSALRRADADVYYHNSAEYSTGLAAAWCRWRGRPLVYSVANDPACQPGLRFLTKRYERELYRYGLTRAHRVIVQTLHQQRLLHEGFGVTSVPLPMPCPGPSAADYRAPELPRPLRVVWVGRIVEQKRLEWLLELAPRLPEVSFEVASAKLGGDAYAQGLYARATQIANLSWLGAVARAKMPELYRSALCLCCTSQYEGFPNTFLEAWSLGIPVVSTFDPDGLIAARKLGFAAKDLAGLEAGIRSLAQSPDTWRECCDNGRRYFEENHLEDEALGKFERELAIACRENPRRG